MWKSHLDLTFLSPLSTLVPTTYINKGRKNIALTLTVVLHGKQRRTWVNAVLSERVLLTWDGCVENSGTSALSKWKSVAQRSKYECWQCLHNISTAAFYPEIVMSGDCSPTETALLRLEKPAALIQRCIIDSEVCNNTRLCSAVVNKHTEPPRSCGFSIKGFRPEDPSFSVCSCVCLFVPLQGQSDQFLELWRAQ